jgi:hypothetical protein
VNDLADRLAALADDARPAVTLLPLENVAYVGRPRRERRRRLVVSLAGRRSTPGRRDSQTRRDHADPADTALEYAPFPSTRRPALRPVAAVLGTLVAVTLLAVSLTHPLTNTPPRSRVNVPHKIPPVSASTGHKHPGSPPTEAVQERLLDAMDAEQTFFTDNSSYEANGIIMMFLDRSLNWVTGQSVSAGNNVLITLDTENGGVILTTVGSNGQCYSLEPVDGHGPPITAVSYGTYYIETDPLAPSKQCSAPTPPAATPTADSRADNIVGAWAQSW